MLPQLRGHAHTVTGGACSPAAATGESLRKEKRGAKPVEGGEMYASIKSATWAILILNFGGREDFQRRQAGFLQVSCRKGADGPKISLPPTALVIRNAMHSLSSKLEIQCFWD
jgi:hypothetical protein